MSPYFGTNDAVYTVGADNKICSILTAVGSLDYSAVYAAFHSEDLFPCINVILCFERVV